MTKHTREWTVNASTTLKDRPILSPCGDCDACHAARVAEMDEHAYLEDSDVSFDDEIAYLEGRGPDTFGAFPSAAICSTGRARCEGVQ